MTQTVTLTVGIAASGKTTWARSMVAATNGQSVVISRDDIRIAQGMPHGTNEGLITQLERAFIRATLGLGKDVIVADTNINPDFRDNLIQFCLDLGADVVVSYFPVDFEEAVLRDSRRGPASVGMEVIKKQWEQLHKQDHSVRVYRAS